MVVVTEPCTISCLLVWPELSAPTAGINIVITTNYLYMIITNNQTFIYTYSYIGTCTYMYLDLQWRSLEGSLPANAELPLKFVTLNYLLWTAAGQKYKMHNSA